MNILAMLQTMIVVMIVLGVGVSLLYAWLKHTGRLPGKVTRSGGDNGD